jgi:hypothetical protein
MDMPSPFRRSLPIAGVAVVLVAALAGAETPAPGAPPHLRPETEEGRALLAELTNRSPSARALVDRLDRSDVVVYVRYRAFMTPTLEGRIGLVSSTKAFRYLAIELACNRTRRSQLATLSHELQHAVEIAGDPSVVDTATLGALYERIGVRTASTSGAVTFESVGAISMGERALRELTSVRNSHERH